MGAANTRRAPAVPGRISAVIGATIEPPELFKPLVTMRVVSGVLVTVTVLY